MAPAPVAGRAPEVVAPAKAAAAAATAHPARRCGECHESHLAEWSGSAHAEADRSPVYQAMRRAAPEAAACDRCHAPLAAVLGRVDPLAAEGVTCDVCHAISAVEADPSGAASSFAWTLQLAGNRKYGPLCDVEEPYFHRAGCSPLHAESRLCGACHHLTVPGDAGPLPVFSELTEWQHGEAMSAGVHCQGCHMPKLHGVVATGGPQRADVSQHGDGPRPGDALKVEASVRRGADGLEVAGVVRVSGVAHGLPAGVPGRELALICELVDGAGQVLATAETIYSRVLVDAGGHEVPFFVATEIGADTRLQADEARPFTLHLPAAPAGAAVALRLVDRPLSAALARALAIAPPSPRVLLTRRYDGPWKAAR